MSLFSVYFSFPLNRAGCPFPLSLFCNPVKLKLIRLLLIPAQLNNSIYWLRFTYRINGGPLEKPSGRRFYMEGNSWCVSSFIRTGSITPSSLWVHLLDVASDYTQCGNKWNDSILNLRSKQPQRLEFPLMEQWIFIERNENDVNKVIHNQKCPEIAFFKPSQII